MAKPRGKLIVFEGLDRSGKSTQCELLVDHLRRQGQSVAHMRFPNRSTSIGRMIDSYLGGQTQQEDHVIHLLFSANRWECAQKIEDLIMDGTSVVVDRYYYSGCVYSAAKQHPSMDLVWCRQPEVGLPRPDICFFLEVSAEESAKRGGFGSERYEKQEIQERVRTLFAEMKTHPDEADDTVTIDAGRSIDAVEKSIQDALIAVIDRVETLRTPLRRVRPW